MNAAPRPWRRLAGDRGRAVITKICGITSLAALEAAVDNGALMVGFVFYPPSPRYLAPTKAATLVDAVPSGVDRVGVFVDPTDAFLDDVLGRVRLDMVQLHGEETPARVKQVRDKYRLPVIKAIKLGAADDVDKARDFDGVADWLMFEAPAPDRPDALPGGNAQTFDWRLLAGRKFRRPWLLSGGLNAQNVAVAVKLSGALAIDVSSGVEDAPGRKNPARIEEFLATTAAL
jgi:phosphoribosylanthranilate isomerase